MSMQMTVPVSCLQTPTLSPCLASIVCLGGEEGDCTRLKAAGCALRLKLKEGVQKVAECLAAVDPWLNFGWPSRKQRMLGLCRSSVLSKGFLPSMNVRVVGTHGVRAYVCAWAPHACRWCRTTARV